MGVQLGRNAIADRDDGLRIVLAQAVDLAHAEAQRETGTLSTLKPSFVMPAKAGIQ